RDDALGSDFENATRCRRVGPKSQYRKNTRWWPLLMSSNKFCDIEICQIVGMRDKKVAGAKPFAIRENCAARAQELVFMNEINSIAERRPRNVIAHDV